MSPSIHSLLLLAAGLLSVARAQYDPALVGTWSTKSKAVLTGPGFFNITADRLIEPALTGISYSFTIDGHFEEAYYRAISNPTTPACPSGIMQWQHGTYSLPGNGSILTQPIAVDGRQLMSTPCSYDESVYTRYSQPELFLSYQVETDPYYQILRLNLYRFDGSPMNPMYLMSSSPEMLPTTTLLPTTTSTTAGSNAKRTAPPTARHEPREKRATKPILPASDPPSADRWWWAGIGLTALGTVMYMIPTSV